MVEFNGLGHSAAVHTQDEEVAEQFGKVVPACRILWNTPATFGGIGDVYNSLIPSLTLGCGSYGGNSVSGNIGAVNLLNYKIIGRRNNNLQWYKIPPKVYFEPNAIRYLSEMEGLERVMIVTDESMVKLGFAQRIIDQLNRRKNKVAYEVFAGVEPNPDITTVKRGLEIMNSFKPNAIVSLGGGSAIDAGKIMWLFYERPDADFKELIQKFSDIRKRTVKYPHLGNKAKFIAVATTSGTGSEVTPFAVISDKEHDKKYPLADYALTPNVAIVDPNLVMTVPARPTAATGMDVLTHATEAYTSILANDYTDGIALQAIKIVFENLEKSVKEFDRDAREKMHNASCLAGMAFSNALLGIVHSMAHKTGAAYSGGHIVHGCANAMYLPKVIKYNAKEPEAAARYAKIAKFINLPGNTDEELVDALIARIREMNKDLDIPTCIKYYEGGIIDEKEFMEKLPKVAELAVGDACTGSNPRSINPDQMAKLLKCCYYDEEVDF